MLANGPSGLKGVPPRGGEEGLTLGNSRKSPCVTGDETAMAHTVSRRLLLASADSLSAIHTEWYFSGRTSPFLLMILGGLSLRLIEYILMSSGTIKSIAPPANRSCVAPVSKRSLTSLILLGDRMCGRRVWDFVLIFPVFSSSFDAWALILRPSSSRGDFLVHLESPESSSSSDLDGSFDASAQSSTSDGAGVSSDDELVYIYIYKLYIKHDRGIIH